MRDLPEFVLLKKYNFKLLPYGIAKNENEAIGIAEKLGYPVAVKIISKQITHKTEVEGVKIGIKNHVSLAIALREIKDIERAKKIKIDGYLIQKMARKGIELIIGAKKDPQFGHLIVLGLGGIYVEIFRDISARLCPINENDVDEMIDELKSHPVITGARGKKAIDITELKKLMLNVCKFVTKENIKEMDLNPVVFDEHGCDIIDVRFSR